MRIFCSTAVLSTLMTWSLFINTTICIYIYIYIYIYIQWHNEFITSSTSMFNETVSKDIEILLAPLDLIKHIHDMTIWLYYGHWTDKGKYIPYISVVRISQSAQVLKSCRSKIATWAHGVYDAHEASSLFRKTCRWGSFIYVIV